MGNVTINIANGQLGAALATEDGVVGMVLTGAGSATMDTPVLYTSLAAAVNDGITLADEPFVYRQVKDFFYVAGTGSKLYLLLRSADHSIGEISYQGNVASCEALLDYAAGRIKLLGIMTNDAAVATASGDATTIDGGLNELVYNAITNVSVIAETYAAAQKPFRCVIGGTSYSGVAGDLTDITTYTKNRVSVLIGDTQSGDQASLGLLMGWLAKLPVQRKISRVLNGSLPITTAFLGTDDMAALPDVGAPGTIETNGFITFKTYPGLAGYYFSSDPTASHTNDDFHALARGRIIDKVQRLAYQTFVLDLDDEVPVNDDGTIDEIYRARLQQDIINQLTVSMVAKKEVKAVTAYIDPAQNVIANETVEISVSITPYGYSKTIIVNLGFRNPALV
jgi:hypothetical protein